MLIIICLLYFIKNKKRLAKVKKKCNINKQQEKGGEEDIEN